MLPDWTTTRTFLFLELILFYAKCYVFLTPPKSCWTRHWSDCFVCSSYCTLWSERAHYKCSALFVSISESVDNYLCLWWLWGWSIKDKGDWICLKIDNEQFIVHFHLFIIPYLSNQNDYRLYFASINTFYQ